MSRESIVFLTGVIVTAVPLLGIPGDWKQIVLFLAGGILIVVGYQLRRSSYFRSIQGKNGELRTDAFVENRDDEHFSDEEHHEV